MVQKQMERRDSIKLIEKRRENRRRLNCKGAIRSRLSVLWGENSRRRGCRSGPPTLVVDSCTRKRRAAQVEVGTGRQKWGGEPEAGDKTPSARVFVILVLWVELE